MKVDYSLRNHNTLRLDVRAEYFARCGSEAELRERLAWAARRRLPVSVLGEGSNLLLTADVPGLVLCVDLPGVGYHGRGEQVDVMAAAGEGWHSLVEQVVDAGLWGIESLALIPGRVGAAPVQNIGAYGAELADCCVAVRVLDRRDGEVRELAADACGFGYRQSRFRGEADRWIILGVRLRLSRSGNPRPHARLQARLPRPVRVPREVFDAVCGIRRSVLPHPHEVPNAGSFFRNPRISHEHYARLRARLSLDGFVEPGIEGVKIPAARLLDELGMKGMRVGGAMVSPQHALVIVNDGNATPQDVVALARQMRQAVLDAFDVALEPEPVVWPRRSRSETGSVTAG